jgi:hypothetical protein
MAYTIMDPLPGCIAKIENIDDRQRFPAATEVTGYDPTFGYARFVYLSGAASTAVGDMTRYAQTGATTRTVAGSRGPCAVAMVANTSTSGWAWYMVKGVAVVNCATVVANAPIFSTATAGQVDDLVAAGDKISNAMTLTANAAGATTVGGFPVTGSQPSYTVGAGQCLCAISYPFMDGDG